MVVIHVVSRIPVQVVHDELIGIQSCDQWVSSLVQVREGVLKEEVGKKIKVMLL